MKDPIVEEIREIRRQIEREFDDDVNKLLEHIYKQQKAHPRKLASRQPRRLEKRPA